jgi:Asp-tRNA(Asn)/Glu-tRNA(Gln) amidotransferase A subunit family amidase
MLSRKDFVTTALLSLSAAALPAGLPRAVEPASEITLDDLKAFEKIGGFSLSDEERKDVLTDVRNYRTSYEGYRKLPISYQTEPSLVFMPLGGGSRPKAKYLARASATKLSRAGLSDTQIAFLSLRELAHLVRTRQISSVELTELYLKRLKKHGPGLLNVITMTEEHALRQARQADAEIAGGKYRGPLHGVPYGIKDLFATKGILTTWGAEPYKDYVPDFDSAVVERLDRAGAVMVAKLSMGALAMDNVWFGGPTKNPWNTKQGSSGSSAGSASATAAGLVGFSIGTETLGSIISPSVRCRVSGLRPTFGRVSRFGGMALSFTMDKVGPICREVEDCALVLAAIAGADSRDPSCVDRTFSYSPRKDLKGVKVGYYVEGKNDSLGHHAVAESLRKAGATLAPVSFAPVPDGVTNVLDAEYGSAFDEFTRGDKIDHLHNSEWPHYFRVSRFLPAVEYLQAHRARTLLMQTFEREFGDLDAFIAEDVSPTLVHTNLTGHPQVVVPQGDDGKGNSRAISITGRLYEEAKLIQVARVAQEGGNFHHLHPDY